MSDSTFRQAGTQAGKRVLEAWLQLSRTVGAKLPAPPSEVQRLLDSLGQGLVEYSDTVIRPLRQLLRSQREFIDQTEQWAQMQKKFNEQTIEWAQRQREIYAKIESLLRADKADRSSRARESSKSSKSSTAVKPNKAVKRDASGALPANDE